MGTRACKCSAQTPLKNLKLVICLNCRKFWRKAQAQNLIWWDSISSCPTHAIFILGTDFHSVPSWLPFSLYPAKLPGFSQALQPPPSPQVYFDGFTQTASTHYSLFFIFNTKQQREMCTSQGHWHPRQKAWPRRLRETKVITCISCTIDPYLESGAFKR